jgi:hypothetical protein
MDGDLFTQEVRKMAVISACGQYRYRLTRWWGGGKFLFLPFVMLNPSTADADIDDPTIRRCMAFARRENAGGIIVVNLYAFRATKPAMLKTTSDPVGPGNYDHLEIMAIESDRTPIVCAWGAGANDAAQEFLEIAEQQSSYLVCLGKTKDGHPRHPLYVRGDQPFEPYP